MQELNNIPATIQGKTYTICSCQNKEKIWQTVNYRIQITKSDSYNYQNKKSFYWKAQYIYDGAFNPIVDKPQEAVGTDLLLVCQEAEANLHTFFNTFK